MCSCLFLVLFFVWDCPIVFLLCSYNFPITFLLIPYHSPVSFRCVSCYFPIVLYCVPVSVLLFPAIPPLFPDCVPMISLLCSDSFPVSFLLCSCDLPNVRPLFLDISLIVQMLDPYFKLCPVIVHYFPVFCASFHYVFQLEGPSGFYLRWGGGSKGPEKRTRRHANNSPHLPTSIESRGSRSSSGNGVRNCCSGPPFHTCRGSGWHELG